MAPLTLERSESSWLEQHAEEWVEAGLISEEQAAGIKRHEHVGVAEPRKRLTLFAEVAAYVGSAIAVMGGAAVVSQLWEDIARVGRIAVGLVVALVGFWSGSWIARIGEAGTSRLGGFLWAIGTGGVAITSLAVLREFDPANEGLIPLVTGLAVLAVSLGLWRNLTRPMQLLTAAVGAGLSLGGLGELLDTPGWVRSLVLMVLGLTFAVAAALRKVRPRLLAVGVGAFGAFIGAFMLQDLSEHLGPAAALAVAIGLVWFALRERMVPLLVGGVIGSLVSMQALMTTTFTEAVSAVVVTVLGVAIVAYAIIQTLRRA